MSTKHGTLRFYPRAQPAGGGGGSGPWTTTAGFIHPIVITNPVGVGVAVAKGSEIFRVLGRALFESEIIIGDTGSAFARLCWEDGSSAPVSAAGSACIRWNDTLKLLEKSEDGAGYVPLSSASVGATVIGTYSCPAAVAVGEAVFKTGVGDAVDKADASDPTKFAIGVVISKPIATTCVVISNGESAVFGGLSIGATYFLSDSVAGALTTTAPTAGGSIVQKLAVAKNATTHLVEVTPLFVQL